MPSKCRRSKSILHLSHGTDVCWSEVHYVTQCQGHQICFKFRKSSGGKGPNESRARQCIVRVELGGCCSHRIPLPDPAVGLPPGLVAAVRRRRRQQRAALLFGVLELACAPEDAITASPPVLADLAKTHGTKQLGPRQAPRHDAFLADPSGSPMHKPRVANCTSAAGPAAIDTLATAAGRGRFKCIRPTNSGNIPRPRPRPWHAIDVHPPLPSVRR